MNQKLVVVGSSNIDLLMKVNRLPEKGETVTDGEFLQCYGGKGANQAVAAAGDTFCGAFAVAWVEGKDVSNRLQIKIKRAPRQSRRVKVANMVTG